MLVRHGFGGTGNLSEGVSSYENMQSKYWQNYEEKFCNNIFDIDHASAVYGIICVPMHRVK
jgi:hypothetical protein